MLLATPTIPRQWKEAINNLLQFVLFVVVISLDFSEAFDTVPQSLHAAVQVGYELDLPTPVYNWLVDFFSGHSHQTVFSGDVSRTRSITASIIQGSSIGSATYTVTTADLRPLNIDNIFIKFADDTYLVISAANISTRATDRDR